MGAREWALGRAWASGVGAARVQSWEWVGGGEQTRRDFGKNETMNV